MNTSPRILHSPKFMSSTQIFLCLAGLRIHQIAFIYLFLVVAFEPCFLTAITSLKLSQLTAACLVCTTLVVRVITNTTHTCNTNINHIDTNVYQRGSAGSGTSSAIKPLTHTASAPSLNFRIYCSDHTNPSNYNPE
jgi:hypothetical protein